jgi:hypothetical protein
MKLRILSSNENNLAYLIIAYIFVHQMKGNPNLNKGRVLEGGGENCFIKIIC